MSAEFFVDSNILVYAHDVGAGRKHEVARELTRRLCTEDLNHGQRYGSVEAINPFL